MSTDRIRAVLVEDDPRALGQYVHWTPDLWSVAAVRTGEEALSTVAPDTDVVVVGVDPPDQPAYRLLERLRSRGHGCQLAVVSAGGSDVDWEVHGADGVAPAPVDRSSYRETLERLADRIAYDRRLEEYYSLVSDLAVMEARRSGADLDDDPQYQQLLERASDLSEELDETLDDIVAVDDYGSVFQGFFPGRSAEE